jgi:hypothetical protein
MKKLLTFDEFVNESRLNEAKLFLYHTEFDGNSFGIEVVAKDEKSATDAAIKFMKADKAGFDYSDIIDDLKTKGFDHTDKTNDPDDVKVYLSYDEIPDYWTNYYDEEDLDV